MRFSSYFISVLLSLFMLFVHSVAYATEVIEINITKHLFYPSEITIAAYTKVKLIVINNDDTAEEFESYELNREKVIPPHSRGVIFIGPLEPGIYPFFGEFFAKTAQGKVIVKKGL